VTAGRRSNVFALLTAVLSALVAGCSTTPSPVRTHFNKGVLLYDDENYAGAAREYRLALEEDPLDHRARFNLAVTLEEMERTDLARAEYEWILSVRPEDLRASANLAAIDIETGNAEAGYARLQGLVDRYQTMAMPRVALATHYFREGRLDEAEMLVFQALKIDGSDIEANFLHGQILEKRGQLAEARASYERALKNAPNDVASLLALGRVERALGRPDLARSYLRRAVSRRRNSLEAHRALAELEEEAGNLEAAAGHLWELRRLDREGADRVSSDLTRVYRELLRREEGRAASQPASDGP
jgi:tetratricopeptide (TPR) repeat protein